jgi:hypothetical protein
MTTDAIIDKNMYNLSVHTKCLCCSYDSKSSAEWRRQIGEIIQFTWNSSQQQFEYVQAEVHRWRNS